MKYLKLIAVVVFSSVLSFSSCKEATKAPEKEPLRTLTIEDLATPQTPTTQNPAALEAPQNTMGVWHYTCSQGCAGGAGAATNCATCGGLLAHNAAYHANMNPTPTFASPAAAAPSQNAAGIWHYSCGKGCAGGSGAAGTCNICGTAMAHNQAYHQ